MKAKTPRLSHGRLLELLSYDRETGDFTWRIDRNQIAKAGSVAGKTHHSGYIYIGIDGERILAHRLAWFFIHGEWPAGQVDHRDGIRANNAIKNLRDVTQSVNSQNQRCAKSDNSTGLLGVSSNKGKFVAQINIGGRNKHLGYFGDKRKAHEVYLAAKRAHHEGCSI